MATKTRTQGSPGLVSGWLAWKRRSRPNKVLFLLSVSLALFVTAVFTWATLNPAPGDGTRYLLLY